MTKGETELSEVKIGYALTGSFCTFEKAFEAVKKLVELKADVTPIMSFNAYSIDTRFGSCEKMQNKFKEITGKEIIHTIEDAEPIGPKKMFDILIIAPCTGNTLSKLANNITDTPVTLAVKSHLRNSRPVLIGISSNDALSGSASNIGKLLNRKNYFFVPFSEDNPKEKPRSIVSDFSLIPLSAHYALSGVQIQPMIKG